MTIIDFRFRPHTAETLAGISNSSMFKGLCRSIDFPHMQPQSLEDIVKELDNYHVVKAVITGRDCETTYAAKPNNDGVLEFMQKYPDKFIGYAGVDPHKGMHGIRQLQYYCQQGMKGAAIDPYLAHIYVNDAKYYPIYAKCCELNIPVIIATGPASLVPKAVIDHAAPRYIDFVARDFPELTIIVSHGGYPWVNEMIIVAQRNENVYLELSEYESFPMSEAYIQAMNTIISDKILYASAHPFVDFRQSLACYKNMPLNDDVREKTMWKNAAKILGLSDLPAPTAAAHPAQAGAPANMEQLIIENVLRELGKRGLAVK